MRGEYHVDKRIGYITEPRKLVDYFLSVGQFHDYLIGSFPMIVSQLVYV